MSLIVVVYALWSLAWFTNRKIWLCSSLAQNIDWRPRWSMSASTILAHRWSLSPRRNPKSAHVIGSRLLFLRLVLGRRRITEVVGEIAKVVLLRRSGACDNQPSAFGHVAESALWNATASSSRPLSTVKFSRGHLDVQRRLWLDRLVQW